MSRAEPLINASRGSRDSWRGDFQANCSDCGSRRQQGQRGPRHIFTDL